LKFPHYKQRDSQDCGPTCIRIIAKHYGKSFSQETLREIVGTTRAGSFLSNISTAAESIGFRTLGVKISLTDLLEAPLPCIVHWNNEHWVVLFKIRRDIFYVSDPAHGILKYKKKEFYQSWIGGSINIELKSGIALLFEKTPDFYLSENDIEERDNQGLNLKFIYNYLFKYKPFILQLIIGLVAGSLLQLILPFLTQSVVDVGIKNQDINFVYLILLAQLLLFVGRVSISVLRSWILLHLSTRISISMIADFFVKLMKLPIGFFDTRVTGDILQRINDHKRIEKILTNSSLNVLFSLINILVFGFVLILYSWVIFLTFLIGSLFYFFWIIIFLKKRRALDYKKFSQISQEQSKVIELINGMQEIKLHNAERQKRWSWEYLQAKLYKISIESLSLEQYQSVGSNFINELKNILISVLSAKLVIDGEITLGMMLAISYIVGQLNNPISQLIGFIRQVQDARISLERLSEIHLKEEEGNKDDYSHVDIEKPITLSNVYFSYKGSKESVLNNITVNILKKKITAVVGESGSGKTTLMKLLLKFYNPDEGSIQIGDQNLKNINPRVWRENTGSVMQEGYIFNDTIANNIAVGVDVINQEKLIQAVEIANIKDFIESLSLSYNTKIGMEGQGISTGQKQRILIARAIYKNPGILLFDEATSALDSTNEKIIMTNLNKFFKNRTVIIIAHRLSTVRNADQIVVMDKGSIIEIGTHEELVDKKGRYYRLVKNQLELGK